jgi:hypothetical protein
MAKKSKIVSFQTSRPIRNYRGHQWAQRYWNGKEYNSLEEISAGQIEREAQAYEDLIKPKRRQNAA